MRIAVTGATGFVGRPLVGELIARGHHVAALVRDEERAAEQLGAVGQRESLTITKTDLFDAGDTKRAIEGCEGVINLAGENIFGKRWNKESLKVMRDSRVVTTRALVDAIQACNDRPQVLVSGSAVGFYGARDPDHVCAEDEIDAQQFAPRDVLAHMCLEWEAAAKRVELFGVREVRLRIGIVLGRGGGALSKMERIFKLGAGGRIGSGKQVMSWIHRRDLVRLITFCLEDARARRAMNCTAPTPVSNRVFTKALGKALRRPTIFPIPPAALRLALGKVAQILATGQNAPPRRALGHGFSFHYPTIDEALAAIYPPKTKGAAP